MGLRGQRLAEENETEDKEKRMSDIEQVKPNEVAVYDGIDWLADVEDKLVNQKYVKLISYGSKALIPGSESFMEGVEAGDYIIKSEKYNFGKLFSFVVSGIKIEYTEKESDSTDSKNIHTYNRHEFDQFVKTLAPVPSKIDATKTNPGKWMNSDGHVFQQRWNLYCISADDPGMGGLCLTFESANEKIAQNLITRTRTAKSKEGVPLQPYQIVWSLGSVQMPPAMKGANPYLVPTIYNNFVMADDALVAQAKVAFESCNAAIKAGRIQSIVGEEGQD